MRDQNRSCEGVRMETVTSQRVPVDGSGGATSALGRISSALARASDALGRTTPYLGQEGRALGGAGADHARTTTPVVEGVALLA